ncbi:MAG: DUF3810 domain-containing protein, partial [Acidimicrobiia bacterium]|nr:DUF3810 domain-containing protein [Acidimicrobiia bacterium]
MTRSTRRRVASRLAGSGIVLLAVAAALAPLDAELVERWYSTAWFPLVQPALTSLSNLVPVPWLDVLIVGGVVWLVREWRDALRNGGEPRARRVVQALGRTTVAAASVYLVFLLCWGLNYRRVPLTGKLVFDGPPPEPAAVVQLGEQAVGRLNALHDAAYAAGWPDPAWPGAALRAAAAQVWQDVGAPGVIVPARMKPTLLRWVFRWNGVDGMTNPFGLEVLRNPDLLPFERPFVAAHEWAHLAGYAHEAEASFVGWLTCVRADAPAQYSGWLFLYHHVAGALAPEERQVVEAGLDEGPRADLRAIADRIRRGSLPRLRRVSWAAYDGYLKANRVPEGVRSYGEVLTLIMRARL